jgi:anti-sigma-K factor RskA
MMTHEEIQADLSLFALGALDPDECQAIEAHLGTGCTACEQELASWREVVGAMALADQEAEPPDLKPALIQRLRSPAASAAPKLVSRPPAARPSAIWLRAAVPLAAAAVALFAVAVVREASLRRDIAAQRQLVASLQQELSTAHGNLQHLSEQLAARENDVASLRAALATAQESIAVVEAPGLQLMRLKQTPAAQPAEAHLLMSPETHRALFYAFDLPAVAADKTYELWWITEKEGPINAGVFRPDQNGLGRVETTVPSEAGAIQAVAVTVEPARGLPKPTGPMILLGAVGAKES